MGCPKANCVERNIYGYNGSSRLRQVLLLLLYFNWDQVAKLFNVLLNAIIYKSSGEEVKNSSRSNDVSN